MAYNFDQGDRSPSHNRAIGQKEKRKRKYRRVSIGVEVRSRRGSNGSREERMVDSSPDFAKSPIAKTTRPLAQWRLARGFGLEKPKWGKMTGAMGG